jgi:hypothetical protein
MSVDNDPDKRFFFPECDPDPASTDTQLAPIRSTQCSGLGSVSFRPHRSVSQRYGSVSSHHQAKTVRKSLTSTVFNVLYLLYDFLSVKNDVNVPSKSKKQKTFGILKVNDKKSKIRIRILISKSDSEPCQLLLSLKNLIFC